MSFLQAAAKLLSHILGMASSKITSEKKTTRKIEQIAKNELKCMQADCRLMCAWRISLSLIQQPYELWIRSLVNKHTAWTADTRVNAVQIQRHWQTFTFDTATTHARDKNCTDAWDTCMLNKQHSLVNRTIRPCYALISATASWRFSGFSHMFSLFKLPRALFRTAEPTQADREKNAYK